MEYRTLTTDEIEILENQNCWADDWSNVLVDDEFQPSYYRRVTFYGEIKLGRTDKSLEVSDGFFKHTGINNAVLHNVSIGDDCLIENIHNHISNYTIGDECYIANVATIETTEGASYGEGNLISVLNEAGAGNLLIFHNLNSQLAAFMVKHSNDQELRNALRRLVNEEIQRTLPEHGTVGNNVKIVNTGEIVNTIIGDDGEVSGAKRLCDCTFISSPKASVYVGTSVICENSIVDQGASLTNDVKIQDCFVGESSQLNNGFTASSSIFLANSVMTNGEACAAFCGPFSTSHHKSSLLIGGWFSFYNAGSATNFSNHAYKMGPLHWGVLERGAKTASGAHLLMPAHIGAFSVCMGKIASHPDTRTFPFSYIIQDGYQTLIVPGRNLTTVGLYRDVNKWPKRDQRPQEGRKSLIHFDWLSPAIVNEIVSGKHILERLQQSCGTECNSYSYRHCTIKASSLRKGLAFYNMALHLYMGKVLLKAQEKGFGFPPANNIGAGHWSDLAGLYLPESEEQHLVSNIKNGDFETIQEVNERFVSLFKAYPEYEWRWAYQLIRDQYGFETIGNDEQQRILNDYKKAKSMWIDAIKKDAEKEFALGDVAPDVLNKFIQTLPETNKQEL